MKLKSWRGWAATSLDGYGGLTKEMTFSAMMALRHVAALAKCRPREHGPGRQGARVKVLGQKQTRVWDEKR